MELGISGGYSVVSDCALDQCKAWDHLLRARIALQRTVDICNTLPVMNGNVTSNEQITCSNILKRSLIEIQDAVTIQEPINNVGTPSMKKSKIDIDSDQLWLRLEQSHKSLVPEWKNIIDKWNSRMNFGHESGKSKLKVLNYSMWDQINEVLSDDLKVSEKSRMLFQESKRLRKEEDIVDNNTPFYDEEVYDDHLFYVMLLKQFASLNSNINHNTSDIILNAEDVKEISKYKKHSSSKPNVDRKASKGRRLRYVPHVKLQNFMFPLVTNNLHSAHEDEMDGVVSSDRLFSSLFQ